MRDTFPDSRHVTDLDLDTATDREIWDHARERAYIIISKDSDFRQLAFLYGLQSARSGDRLDSRLLAQGVALHDNAARESHLDL